jgi:hypothetical protein
MKRADEIRNIIHESSFRERRHAEFCLDFLEYTPSIGEKSISRLKKLFPCKVSLSKEQLEDFLVDLSWSSTELEGVKISHIDSYKRLIERAKLEKYSTEVLQLIDNHGEAFKSIVNSDEISLRKLRELQSILSSPGNITGESRHFVLKGEEGEIRTDQRMRLRNTSYSPPQYQPGLANDTIYSLISRVMDTAYRIDEPLECAVYILSRVPYVQAFFDANKRTSRMMANIPLLSNGLLPITYEQLNKNNDYLDAMISIYEFRDTGILSESFILSYVDSCLKYYPLADGVDWLVTKNVKEARDCLSAFVIDGTRSRMLDRFLDNDSSPSP